MSFGSGCGDTHVGVLYGLACVKVAILAGGEKILCLQPHFSGLKIQNTSLNFIDALFIEIKSGQKPFSDYHLLDIGPLT